MVDSRGEHEREFRFIQERMGGSGTPRFIRGDVSHADVKPSYDVMLVQGLLYHLFDHWSFLQLMRAERKYIILETELSGYSGYLSLAKFEDVGDLRMGVD